MTLQWVTMTMTFIHLRGMFHATLLILCFCSFAWTSFCPSFLCTCIGSRSIVCSKKNLDKVPTFTDMDMDNAPIYDMLDLSRNAIASIPPEAFDNIRVKHIDLSRNEISGISPRGFDGVAKTLQSLNLYNAGIKVSRSSNDLIQIS